MDEKINIFWFRRDLRLHDNGGLLAALSGGLPVLPVFIFDTRILGKLSEQEDERVAFIHRELAALKKQLEARGSSLFIFHGTPAGAFELLTGRYRVAAVYCNRDYEPYAVTRDGEVEKLLSQRGTVYKSFRDHLIFEPGEVVKDDGSPYTVFTPYSRKWKSLLTAERLKRFPPEELMERFFPTDPLVLPSLEELGFREQGGHVIPSREIRAEVVRNYGTTRDYPAMEGTSRLGLHLRFGTVSTREVVSVAWRESEVFLGELIWREFFATILAHFPYVADGPFKKKYGFIPWRNNEAEFEKWCRGETGYPMVDAGMRELNETGFMHNRVRMITASFLTKHLLIDWRWGEAVFAEKLLDFELSSNNGNWQWAAGCGCDAAPYFRVFNPEIQQKKFDPKGEYVRRWVPEAGTKDYPPPVVEHAMARNRAIETYRKGLS